MFIHVVFHGEWMPPACTPACMHRMVHPATAGLTPPVFLAAWWSCLRPVLVHGRYLPPRPAVLVFWMVVAPTSQQRKEAFAELCWQLRHLSPARHSRMVSCIKNSV